MAVSSVNLESFYVDIDTVPQARLRFDDLIGRGIVTDMLKGSMPYFSDDAVHVNFSELTTTIRPGTYTKSAAFLFLGEPGNGKHTMDKAYLHYLRETFEDQLDGDEALSDSFRYYQIDADQLLEDSGAKTNENLNALFDGVEMSYEKDENIVLRYLSFGDLSGLFRKRKSVNLFARRLEQLIAGEDVFCIVTACSDTLPAELPPAILRAFVPFYLAPPTDRQRQQYFHSLKDKYSFIHWELSPDEISERTRTFSFRMLNNAVTYLLLHVKGEMIDQDLKMERYLPFTQPGVKPITLSEDDIEDAIAMAKSTAVFAGSSRLAMPAQYVAMPGVMPAGMQPALEQIPTATNPNADNKQKQKGENDVSAPDTIEGLKTLVSTSLHVPSVADKNTAKKQQSAQQAKQAQQPQQQPAAEPAPSAPPPQGENRSLFNRADAPMEN